MASLSKDGYRKWLRGFGAGEVVGRRAEEDSCPARRFAVSKGEKGCIMLVDERKWDGRRKPAANPPWLKKHIGRLDAAGEMGESITRRQVEAAL